MQWTQDSDEMPKKPKVVIAMCVVENMVQNNCCHRLADTNDVFDRFKN